MKRYTLDAYTELFSDGLRCNATLLEAADGEYVRHDDAQVEIERLQRALSQAVDSQLDLANRLHATQAENERLRGLLARARKFVADDVQMIIDICRHAPLPPEAQIAHNTAEHPSEALIREIDSVLPNA